ncbi:MAG: hypothetical protein OEZ59_09020 [Deltaproteobacteria bacterium]|nr:hypothetical protein [Deltaproteobacteria bacterium]
MRFKPILLLIYLVLLVVGLGLPALVIMKRESAQFVDLMIYLASGGLVMLATFFISLFLARLFFPEYWWMGQVQGKDIFEYEGIYFIGLRLSRIPTRLQRILFGVDDRMRRWDMLFGLFFMVMMVPHFLGMSSMNRYLDASLPNPPRIYESLHTPIIKSLSVINSLGGRLDFSKDQREKMDRDLRLLKMKSRKTNEDRYLLAQLHIIQAFSPRVRPGEPFLESPGEQLFFNRGLAAQGVVYLNQIFSQAEPGDAGWETGARALLGFFHLSDRNYTQAMEQLELSLATMSGNDKSGFSRYQAQLMYAVAAMFSGERDKAKAILENILEDDKLPNGAYAMAMENLGEVFRLDREWGRADEFWKKALEFYRMDQDLEGIARIHLHQAAMAMDRGDTLQASRELSSASSLASKTDDYFTLNMVAALFQLFKG